MRLACLFAALCCWPLLVKAEIYKSIDENGHVTYSSTPSKGSKRLDLKPLPTMVPPARVKSPNDFPKVDDATQKDRDETRRKILQDELDAEEKLLAESKQNLENVSPEVYQGPDGKTFRNVAKYEENVKQLTEQVEIHQKNVEALKTEISKLNQ